MYKAQKTIEAAAFLLRQREDATMGYYSLIKLLYLADREQIKQGGRTITGDTHWCLPWGPVLEHVLDAVRRGDPDWDAHIRTDLKSKTSVLLEDAPPAALSRADLEILQTVWDKFGHLDGPVLMHYTHALPEYKETKSRVLITLQDIAKAVGKSDEEVRQIMALDAEREDMASLLRLAQRTAVNV